MQTMPTKTRASVAITGIALLVLVVGLIAYGVNQRPKQEARDADPMAQLAEQQNGTAVEPGAAMNAGATADVATGAPVNGAPAADLAAAMPHSSTVEKAEAAPAIATLGAIPATHVVKPDETLYSISMKYYKTKIYAGDIESLNNLPDPNHIEAGTELKLPPPEQLMKSGQ